ncbi:glutathione peroxidase-like [Lycorma delicatula]|uniref:glutathione peroxidase-like n=1 Tax=Lycorma delicatula TaxID=130591 RepID=UPI003F518B5A
MASINVILGLAAVLFVYATEGVKVQRVPRRSCLTAPDFDTIYSYSGEDLWKTRNISLANHKGKFTKHYHGLNALQSAYGNDKLVVLGFPCNQFGLQEPGANATEIWNGIKYVRPGNGFEPNFQLFSKIEVNGENEHSLFTYLKKYCPPTRDGFSDKHELFYQPIKNWDVRWNFEKFLINREGRPVMRYDGSADPSLINDDIQRMLRNEL